MAIRLSSLMTAAWPYGPRSLGGEDLLHLPGEPAGGRRATVDLKPQRVGIADGQEDG